MFAGGLIDSWGDGAHAHHAAARHGGVYAWTLMMAACWLTGWTTMHRQHGRAACLIASTLIMIAVTATLTWAHVTPASTASAHLVMLLTMALSHEAGTRLARHPTPHDSDR